MSYKIVLILYIIRITRWSFRLSTLPLLRLLFEPKPSKTCRLENESNLTHDFFI